MTGLKMRRVRLWAVLVMACLVGIGVHVCSVQVQAASDMSVHAIYLKDPKGKPGSGDAVLVETGSSFLLMDTAIGQYNNQLDEKKYKGMSTARSLVAYLKKVGAGTGSGKPLDVYISHIHADHYGGLQNILEAGLRIRHLYMPVESIGTAVTDYRSFVYAWTRQLAGEYGFGITYLSPFGTTGTVKSFKSGNATVKIIGPAKLYTSSGYSMTNQELENNNSLWAMVSCKGFKFLTMGDALKQAEKDMIKKVGKGLKADLVKQNHHGHIGGNSKAFIDKVKAQRSFACSPKKTYYSVRITRWYSAYGESLHMGGVGHTIVYQKNAKTGKVERSRCSHALSKKKFSRKWTSVTTNRLKITCKACKKTYTEKEYHKCTHKFLKSGCCRNCFYICPHKKFKNGICKKCGFKCTHCKINHKNNQYYKTKTGQYVFMWDKKTKRCKLCGMKKK